VTTYNGHMNAFGERAFVDFRVDGSRTVQAIIDEVKANGAFVSINHPSLPDDETCMGCGWGAFDSETMRRINGIEVVNGNNVEGPLAGWPVWAKMLNAGLRLTAIGGSDDHTADETNDKAIGTPATVVYAEELSEPALFEGLRRGRVYIRTNRSAGPVLQFEATSRNGSWQMGDVIPMSAEGVTLSARVSAASGQQLQWIRNGEVISSTPVQDGIPATLPIKLEPGDWFSIIVRDAKGPTLFSNAIYLGR
jgi:hypothetical protein